MPYLLAAAPVERLAPQNLPPASEVSRQIERILSRSEFQDRQPSLMERLAMWAEEWLQKLGLRLPEISLGGGNADVAQFLVTLAAVAGFVFLIFYFVRLGTRRWKPEQVREAGELEAESAAPGDYFREAEALAATGDYRAALQRAYIGTLLHLGREGHLDFRPARTNWENLRTIQPTFPREEVRVLRRLSRLFDRKWYGHETIGSEEYRRASEELAGLRRERAAA